MMDGSLLPPSLLLAAHAISSSSDFMVGDEVCITGYIMGNAYIFNTGGHLLDNRKITALQNPEQHSFHRLLDGDWYDELGFQILGDKIPDTDRHCLGFHLDDTDAVLAAGRALGKRGGDCSTCTGEMGTGVQFGYRATVRGAVLEMGDGSDGVTGPPILTNIEILDENIGCGNNPSIPPLCALLRENMLSLTYHEPLNFTEDQDTESTQPPSLSQTLSPTEPAFETRNHTDQGMESTQPPSRSPTLSPTEPAFEPRNHTDQDMESTQPASLSPTLLPT
mmetsp:Transcript_13046/g.24918  ORF Transcript_13046/g.24918 Transcript_13046/m.24918 type:complete len:278 (+) Transcript_13046:232-1065(+)